MLQEGQRSDSDAEEEECRCIHSRLVRARDEISGFRCTRRRRRIVEHLTGIKVVHERRKLRLPKRRRPCVCRHGETRKSSRGNRGSYASLRRRSQTSIMAVRTSTRRSQPRGRRTSRQEMSARASEIDNIQERSEFVRQEVARLQRARQDRQSAQSSGWQPAEAGTTPDVPPEPGMSARESSRTGTNEKMLEESQRLETMPRST